MGRHTKDPGLNAYAVELKNLPIQHPQELQDRFKEIDSDFIRGDGWGFRNVYIMPDQRTWAVRLYLNGEQRRIGATECGVTACRFADMALMHFWKYRIRGASEPLDTHLNFGVAQAKKDLEELIEHAFLLEKIEGYLVVNKVLPDEKEVALRHAARVESRKTVERRKTARWELLDRLAPIEKSIALILQRLDGIACAIQDQRPIEVISMRTTGVDQMLDRASGVNPRVVLVDEATHVIKPAPLDPLKTFICAAPAPNIFLPTTPQGNNTNTPNPNE